MCATPQFVSVPSNGTYNITFDREGRVGSICAHSCAQCLKYDLACNPTVILLQSHSFKPIMFVVSCHSGTFHIINRNKTTTKIMIKQLYVHAVSRLLTYFTDWRSSRMFLTFPPKNPTLPPQVNIISLRETNDNIFKLDSGIIPNKIFSNS